MADDGWVEDVRREAGQCPSCEARDARPVFYGMPTPGDVEALGDRVVFVGCLVPEVLHRYACGRCGTWWGRPDGQG